LGLTIHRGGITPLGPLSQAWTARFDTQNILKSPQKSPKVATLFGSFWLFSANFWRFHMGKLHENSGKQGGTALRVQEKRPISANF
jgi:hypothetical protein